jgi:iron(III) transport system ATP-binding protein
MASVQIDAISVDYGKHRVIDKLSLDVRDGESLAIVGPSSCGKTTLMRALCGFIKISEGRIAVDGAVVSSAADKHFVAPEKRQIGVVFQDYAVWPHLTVIENIVYPLKKRRVPKAEALETAQRALAQVKMADFGNRLPAQLSGGQQQRVALARALVSSGKLIVLDEPITNLDAKLREEMAYEIRNLQTVAGVTILYITHDQETAMTIADRMVIMDKKGYIHQIGTPEEIWNNPVDKFVFEFLGVSNFVPITFSGGRLVLKDGDTYQNIEFETARRAAGKLDGQNDLLLAIRPMDVIIRGKPAEGLLTGKVERVTYLGNQFDYIVGLGDHKIRVQQDSFDAFAGGVPREGALCGMDLGNSVFYRTSDSLRVEIA